MVACSAQVYTSFQELLPHLLAPAANIHSHFSDFEQYYPRKDEVQTKNQEEEDEESDEEEGEKKKVGKNEDEFTLRACKVASPIPNHTRIIFALYRPNSLQKQVEQLLKAKATLERANADMQEDTVVLASELESLKKELKEISSDRETIHIGKGESEAERDLIREERNELQVECAALKEEMSELRREMHKMELELDALKEASDKKLLLSDDDSDLEPATRHLNLDRNDESIELDGDDEDDEEVKAGTDINLEDDYSSEEELEKATPKIESDLDSDEKPTTTTTTTTSTTKSKQITVDDDADDEDSEGSLEVDDILKGKTNQSQDLKLDSGSDSEVALTKATPSKLTKLEETSLNDDDDSDWSDS